MTPDTKQFRTLRLVLGDQLNLHHSWFKTQNPDVLYALMEIRSETDYALHHVQKVLAFVAAMRNFANELSKKNHAVTYMKLNDTLNLQTFSQNCEYLIRKHGIQHFEYQLPDEYRVDEELKNFANSLTIPHSVVDTEHFYTTRNELADFFKGKKIFLMESFYRHMRKKHGLLMQGSQPLCGKWNFDSDNRRKLPATHTVNPPMVFSNNVTQLNNELICSGITTIGAVNAAELLWPINRQQSLSLLKHFLQHCLPLFGTFQDAMTPHNWSLYHSRLSFSLNTKLISPQEVIAAAVTEWERRPEEIAYHQLEGFVRQIIGWREFMRGIYWFKMPAFAHLNFFNHSATLPEWYWTGNTKMHCLRHTITQSLQHAYAHHIQRLMITGNFALLAGVHPDEVDKWYLGIYIDAIEWVEITNTRGMSQFADGGMIATKPYVSSAAYIDKMSHYCSGCYYNKSKKTGNRACPFNSLYWNFYDKHSDKLTKNPRIGMMYNVWKKMNPGDKAAILEQAEYYLTHINSL